MMSREEKTKSTGGAKPRADLLPMMALALIGLLALAGVVAADDYYKGAAPVTNATGIVNGSVWVDWKDAWNTTPMDYNNLYYTNISTFTCVPYQDVKFARLYVVTYTGHMTNNNIGNLTVTLTNSAGDTVVTGATPYPLDLPYYPNIGPTYAYPGTPYFRELNRVTSDYVAIFDVASLIDSCNLTVNVTTGNRSDLYPYKFDGRVKEVKLVVAYNDTCNMTGETYYYVNEGHDPVTYRDPGTYTGNVTWFNNLPADFQTNYKADLWVDFVAGNSTSGPGYGYYWWNGTDISPETGTYLPCWKGSLYSGLAHWTWNSTAANIGLHTDNDLRYGRTNNYYKIIVGVLAVKKITTSVFDFSGNYYGQPGINEWAYENEIDSSNPNSATEFPSTDISNDVGIKFFADGQVTHITSSTNGFYAAKKLKFQMCRCPCAPCTSPPTCAVCPIIDMSLTLNVSGYHDDETTNGYDVWVWNRCTNSWEHKYESNDADFHYITIDLSPACCYIDADCNATVLIIQKGAQVQVDDETIWYSHIDNDYDELVVVDP